MELHIPLDLINIKTKQSKTLVIDSIEISYHVEK